MHLNVSLQKKYPGFKFDTRHCIGVDELVRILLCSEFWGHPTSPFRTWDQWQREAVGTTPALNLRNPAHPSFQQFYKGENAVPKFTNIGK